MRDVMEKKTGITQGFGVAEKTTLPLTEIEKKNSKFTNKKECLC